MPPRRSARTRATSALQNTTNAAQDENNAAQRRTRGAGKTASATAKHSAQQQNLQRKPLQPLRDVTNNVTNTRSRPPRKPPVNIRTDADDEITPAPPRRTTRRHNHASRESVPSHEICPADVPPGTARRDAELEESSSDEIRPNPPKEVPRTALPADESSSDEIRPNIVTQRRSGSLALAESSDEIRPRPVRTARPSVVKAGPSHAYESSSDEIRPNIIKHRRRGRSALRESPGEIRPKPTRTGRPSAATAGPSRARAESPAGSDSPPRSPLHAEHLNKPRQGSWSDENREPNIAAFDKKRPRQAVHTYGKRRRVARVSLPTMQALGVRAKSSSGGSQSGSERDEDGEASEEYRESDSESEDSPKRDPKLEAFLAEQRTLWQEVDETDLLVESD